MCEAQLWNKTHTTKDCLEEYLGLCLLIMNVLSCLLFYLKFVASDNWIKLRRLTYVIIRPRASQDMANYVHKNNELFP